MPFPPTTNSVASSYGLLVMFAMDMYTSAAPPSLTPAPDARLIAAGWNVIGYLVGNDALYHKQSALTGGVDVSYGYVAQSATDATNFVAVVRGTNGLIEWIEDAEYPPIPYGPAPGAMVEQGFWGIYATFRMLAPDGSTVPGATVVESISSLVGATGNLMVVGHSLGSSIATYLSLDLARGLLENRVSACLFASPQPGNQDFADFYDQTVANYELYNYRLDAVPQVPPGPDYVALSKETVLQPATVKACIRVDVGCNHHIICYCAMLDFDATPYQHIATIDTACAACILGPATTDPTIAKIIAAL